MIHRVEDPREAAAARRLIADLVDPPCDFNLDWVRRQFWAVVPVNNEFLIGKEDSWLTSAILELGCRECIAVATDPDITENVCPAYRLRPTATSLLEVNWEYGGLNHILLDAERTFAVLFDEEYKLYAGPRAFVERAVGRSIAVARREFLEVHKRLAETSGLRRAYQQVAERYRSFNADD